MDPLSITTAVVTLTGVCLATAKRISQLRTRFNVTSITLTAILSETTVVSASLGQIQAALLQFSSTFSSQFERGSTLLQTLDTAIIGCSVVILALQEEVEKLEVGLLKATNDRNADQIPSNWLFRIKILWKENAMRELLTQIRNQQVSLGFLLQALNMNSMTELHNLMTNSSSILKQVTENTSALCKTYPSIRAPLSIFEVDRDDGVSFFSHTASSAGATEFDFDNFLVDSKVYRRAFQGGYLRPRRLMDTESSLMIDTGDDEARDVDTITDVNGHEEVREDETIRDAESEAGSEESEEPESIMDTFSEHGSVEAQTITPNTSPGLPEEFRILKVKDIDGEIVYMDTKMVEELLQRHENLEKSYRRLQRQQDVVERTFEIQNLENERSELQTHLLGISAKNDEGTRRESKTLPMLPADIFDTFPSGEQLFGWLDNQPELDTAPDPPTGPDSPPTVIDLINGTATTTESYISSGRVIEPGDISGLEVVTGPEIITDPVILFNLVFMTGLKGVICPDPFAHPEPDTSLSCYGCSMKFTGKWSSHDLRNHRKTDCPRGCEPSATFST